MKNNASLLILAIITLGLILALNANRQNNASDNQPPAQYTTQTQGDSPRILFTKPDPLEEAIIGANEVVEIIFNRPLENEGELKLKFDPKLQYKIDYNIELSQDRKTAKIIPLKPYELGSTYTLFIGPDTKFEGVGEWKQEKIYHFKTIRYRGV